MEIKTRYVVYTTLDEDMVYIIMTHDFSMIIQHVTLCVEYG